MENNTTRMILLIKEHERSSARTFLSANVRILRLRAQDKLQKAITSMQRLSRHNLAAEKTSVENHSVDCFPRNEWTET